MGGCAGGTGGADIMDPALAAGGPGILRAAQPVYLSGASAADLWVLSVVESSKCVLERAVKHIKNTEKYKKYRDISGICVIIKKITQIFQMDQEHKTGMW